LSGSVIDQKSVETVNSMKNGVVEISVGARGWWSCYVRLENLPNKRTRSCWPQSPS